MQERKASHLQVWTTLFRDVQGQIPFYGTVNKPEGMDIDNVGDGGNVKKDEDEEYFPVDAPDFSGGNDDDAMMSSSGDFVINSPMSPLLGVDMPPLPQCQAMTSPPLMPMPMNSNTAPPLNGNAQSPPLTSASTGATIQTGEITATTTAPGNSDSLPKTDAIVKTDETDIMTPPKKRRRRRKKVDTPVAKPAAPVIVDIRSLVEEVRAGRYPSMKVYNGEHLDICLFCKTKGGHLFNCEFCPNSEHLGCVKSKVTIRDPERCIQTVLSRRARAEKRRLEKLNEQNMKLTGSSTAGPNGALTGSSVSLEQAKDAAALKREVIWSQPEFDAHVATYSKCPTGGPGGLICCAPCTASCSRLLSETAKEMEAQTVSTVGREVSELVELLHDAQIRLKQAVDVSNGNEIRRSLLNREEVEERSGDQNGGAWISWPVSSGAGQEIRPPPDRPHRISQT